MVKGDKILEGSDQRNMELSKPNVSMDNTNNSPISNSEITESDDIDNSENIHTSHMSDIESTQTSHRSNTHGQQISDIVEDQITHPSNIGGEKITHNDEISITGERNNISDVNDYSESSNIFENGDSTINTSTRNTSSTHDEPMETHGPNEKFHMFGSPYVTEEDYTEKHDYDKHEDFNNERYSNHNKMDDFVYNAGGVVCCVLFFASITFFSMDRSNKDECDFDMCEEVYNNDHLSNYADKEEIIEIVFDENEEKYF